MSNYTNLKNVEGYRLSLTKSKCSKPDGLYKLALTEEISSSNQQLSVSEKVFFMTEEELGRFARALVLAEA
jgi:hypothetical protein